VSTHDVTAGTQRSAGPGWRGRRLVSSPAWRQPLAVVGGIVILAWIVVAIFAPLIAPADPLAQDLEPLKGPSGDFLFGTDELGRDVLSRVLYGARISLPLAALLVAWSRSGRRSGSSQGTSADGWTA